MPMLSDMYKSVKKEVDSLRRMKEGELFHVNEDHLKLLKNSRVSWCYDEFGAPEIDPKRPYGNSNVLNDIKEILGHIKEGQLSPKERQLQEKLYLALHVETMLALQIVLSVGKVEIGIYRKMSDYGQDWEKVRDE